MPSNVETVMPWHVRPQVDESHSRRKEQTMVADADELRISKEKALDLMDEPNVHVIDLRHPEQMLRSGAKIRGAVHEDPNNVNKWADKYAPSDTLILYCA